MPNRDLTKKFSKIQSELRQFIELSVNEDEGSWESWIDSLSSEFVNSCWDLKGCNESHCPAHDNKNARCWIIAGTMCGGAVQGKFARKYHSCKECDVYQSAVLTDPLTEIQEHIIVLIYSLRERQDELKELATTDSLTGIFNRRYLDLFVNKELEKARRGEIGLAVVLIDINNFKSINDTYGHVTGDHVLKMVSQSLAQAARKSDISARYGGDEFIVVMSGADDQMAQSSQRLIERINDNIEHANKRSKDVSVSLSYGVSLYDSGKTMEALFSEADQAMYADKRRSQRVALESV